MNSLQTGHGAWLVASVIKTRLPLRGIRGIGAVPAWVVQSIDDEAWIPAFAGLADRWQANHLNWSTILARGRGLSLQPRAYRRMTGAGPSQFLGEITHTGNQRGGVGRPGRHQQSSSNSNAAADPPDGFMQSHSARRSRARGTAILARSAGVGYNCLVISSRNEVPGVKPCPNPGSLSAA